jgi:tetratricopeptide (TPR) repeat protein
MAAAVLAGRAQGAAVVEGPRSDVTTITCSIAEDGATTCGVSQGAAAICSLRKGQDIIRSYTNYDYLDQPPGCALSRDYWQAHAPGGAANYDEIWDSVGTEGPDTPFFGSSKSFLDILRNADGAQDPYAQLGQAYVATELNLLNGATLPDQVQAALDEASVMLLGTPGGSFDAATAERSQILTATFAEYLAGGVGPGFCAAMTQPFGPDDVGKTLVGAESKDSGTILTIEENQEKPGMGIVTLRPASSEDEFLLADEAFTVEGIRKARFTQTANDCVVANAGEETTVAVGGIPTDPTALSDLMRQLARNLQVMIALNSDTGAPTPGAGPPSGPQQGEDIGGGPSIPGGGLGFPSPVLPPVGGSGGSDLIQVPNVVGLTEAEARGRITSAGLRVGNVTVVSSLSPSDGGLIATAYAQTTEDPPRVVSQTPAAGTLCVPGCAVDIFLSGGSQGMPEPSSLPMIAVALGALAFLLWRRRGGVAGAALFVIVLGASACDNRATEERIQLARQYLEAGRPNGAVIELKKAIQTEPANAEARRLLGNAYVGLGRFSDAEKELSRALTLRPGEPGTALALGRAWLQQGRADQVIAELRPATDWPKPDQSAAWTLRGEAELVLHAPERARISFETAEALDPARVEPLIGIARAARQLEDEEALRVALERGLRLAPGDPVLLGLTGERAFRMGDYAGAEAAFRAQKTAVPDAIGARLGLAQALIAQERDSEAAIEIGEVLKTAPAHPDAQYLAAVVALRSGDYGATSAHASEALRSRPKHAASRALAALAAAERREWTEAAAHYEALRAAEPDHPLLADLGPRIENALKRQSQQATFAPNPPVADELALFRLDPAGIAGLEQSLDAILKDEPQAWTAYRRLMADAPPSWAARGEALAENRAGRPLAARLSLRRWLESHGEDSETRAVLSDLLLLDGDAEAALPHLRRLAAERPRDAHVLNNLAWALAQRGDLREARIVSARAAALAPRDPWVLDTQGLILLRTGEAKAAVAVLRRAAADDAAPTVARIHLAQALIGSDEKSAAKEVLTEALASRAAPDQHRAAALLLQQLER